jgi:hypothetical protein
MNLVEPHLGIQQKIMNVEENVRRDIMQNAEYFEMMGLFCVSYDMASYFVHENGNKYCVVHTLFGPDHKSSFETNMRDAEWRVSISSPSNKRKCILDFMAETGCMMDYVYNIMYCLNGDSSDDLSF